MHDNLNKAIKLYQGEELPDKAVRDRLEAIAEDIERAEGTVEAMDKSIDEIKGLLNKIKKERGL